VRVCAIVKMEVKVKTLQGDVYTLSLPAGGATLVKDFKVMAESACGVPVNEMRLLYHGKVLKDDDALSQYNVESGCVVLLMKKAPAPAQPQPQPQAQPQQQAPPQAQAPPVMPNLFPQNSAAGDTLNTILQQAFQQAFRTGSGVNVNVSLNSAAAGNAPSGSANGTDGQAQQQPAPGARASGPQMQVRVMPITQDIQSLMRDAYAQATGVPLAGQNASSQPIQQQPAQQQPQQQQQENGYAQPMNILQQVLQSIAGARNAAERESDPFDSDEDRETARAAGSMISTFINQLSREADSNPNGSVTNFLERAFGGSLSDSDSDVDLSSDSESDGEHGGAAHGGTVLDRLTREVCNRMSIQELLGLASHSEQSYLKLISVVREILIRDINAGPSPSQEAVDAYAGVVLDELAKSLNEDSLPSEVRERLKEGASLSSSFCDNVRIPLRDFYRLVTSPDLPAQILPRIIDWSHSSLVSIVDGLGAVLQGSVDDVAVILRYLVYTNSRDEVGQEVAMSLATVFSQNVMSRYHRFKAELLQAAASTFSSASSAAASAAPALDIPYDTSVLVPMPPVRTLIDALLQRANTDTVTPNIPLSDTYRSGSMSKHA